MPFIGDLDPAVPAPTDPIGNGDEEIRNLKQTLQDTFPEAGSEAVLFSDLKGGSRNLIINGNFDIWQRGTSFVPGVEGYTADRWYNTFTGIQVDRTTNVPTSISAIYSALITGTGSERPTLIQGIELPADGEAGIFQQNTIFTLSFWVLAPAGKGIRVSIAFTDSANGGNGATILGFTTVATATGSWQKVTTSFNIGAAVPNPTNKVLSVTVQSNSLDSDTLNLTQVQLEQGQVATHFEYRPLAEELALCQRYYFRHEGGEFQIIGRARFASEARAWCVFPVDMRTTPTIETSGTPTDYTVEEGTNSFDCNGTPALIAGSSSKGANLSFGVAGTLTAGQATAVTGKVSGFLGFDAEL